MKIRICQLFLTDKISNISVYVYIKDKTFNDVIRVVNEFLANLCIKSL